REALPRRSRHLGYTHRNRQLRRGASDRSGIRRERLVAEPARRVRDHRRRADAQEAMRPWMVAAPAALLVTTGCLASKSDIRLLQDELRATRSQLAVGDTSLLRANE